MTEPQVIGPGSRVTLHFSIALEDGTVADATEADAPMTFRMGDGSLVEGLELALLGLTSGDRQSLLIDPRDAFGYADPDNVRDMPRSDFPADMAIEAGMIIGFSTPTGDEVPGSVVTVGDDTVTVDLNHPLAGHELTFSVEIVSVENPEGSA